jgi:hypothetical protein
VVEVGSCEESGFEEDTKAVSKLEISMLISKPRLVEKPK